MDQWSDYVLVPAAADTNLLPAGAGADRILAFDKPENHKGKGGCVLYIDGSVVWVNTEEFNKAVAPYLKPRSGPSPGQ